MVLGFRFGAGAILCLLICCTRAQAPEECRIDLAIAVDGSGSIEVDNPVKGNWQKVVNFLGGIVAKFEIGIDNTRVGMVKFDDVASLHFDLNDYATKEAVLNATLSLDYNRGGGRTNTDGALTLVRDRVFRAEHGDRAEVRNVLILLTDGRPTPDLNQNLNNTVIAMKEEGVRIVGVGVTPQVNAEYMKWLVSDTASDYFSVDDFDNLTQILELIILETCRIITDCREPADVFFVMDGSGSIDQPKFELLKNFTSNVAGGLNIDTRDSRAGFVLFGDAPRIVFNLTAFDGNRNDMMQAINAVQYPRGRTRTHEAIRLVRETFASSSGNRANVPDIMVLLTDGNSNSPEDTMREAYLAKQAGIHLITVAIGNWINTMEMKILASWPYQSNYIEVPDYTGLNQAVRKQLIDLICNNLNECNAATCPNCIDMIGTYMCSCSVGTAGRDCDRQCRNSADVTLAMDASGSVGPDNFLLELEFARQLVFGLNFNTSRLAALQYANAAVVQFHLDNQFAQSIAGALNALSMLYTAGTTNTAAALQTINTPIFTAARGDSTTARNVAVVITDGRSNDFEATWSAARSLRTKAEIVAVGIGSSTNQLELEAVASSPVAQNVIRSSSFVLTNETVDAILDAVCNNVDACSPNPCQNGGQCTDRINWYECVCADGFSGRICDRRCGKLYDIVLAFDVSGSIRNERLPQVLDFAAEFVAEFEVSDNAARFAAVTFNNTVQTDFQLNSYNRMQDVVTAVRRIRYRGGQTDITSALELIQSSTFTPANGDRATVQNFILLFSDGSSTLRADELMNMAIDTRAAGINIVSLAIGDMADMFEIQGMTSQPLSQMMIQIRSFTNMTTIASYRQQVMNNILAATCDPIDQCSTSPCPNGQCTNELHTYFCQCNEGFSGQNCNIQCTRSMDVALVLDFSGSLDEVTQIVIAFVSEIVQNLPFTNNRVRVAVVSYSDTPTLHFRLDSYTTKREVLNALSFSRYRGRTGTAAAITMTYTDVFRSDRGDRATVDNVMIVVSDGGSNIQPDQTLPEAAAARSRGIEVFMAAVGSRPPNMGEVNGIASDPDSEHVVRVETAAAVQQAARDMINLLCQ